eukprot:499059-Alexandrium_andersonii.AAC.1
MRGSKLGDGLAHNVLMGAVERLDNIDEDDKDSSFLCPRSSNSTPEGPTGDISAAPMLSTTLNGGDLPIKGAIHQPAQPTVP